MSPAGDAVVARDRVLPGTRVLSIVIIPFLLVAFVRLYFWPSADDTARLFAWRIVPGFTSMVLGAVYLGGAYFFLRAARATEWHTVGGGFIPVGPVRLVDGCRDNHALGQVHSHQCRVLVMGRPVFHDPLPRFRGVVPDLRLNLRGRSQALFLIAG